MFHIIEEFSPLNQVERVNKLRYKERNANGLMLQLSTFINPTQSETSSHLTRCISNYLASVHLQLSWWLAVS